MTTFPNPSIFADFTGSLGPISFIFSGSAYSNFNSWLTAIGGTFSRSGAGGYYTNPSGLLAVAANNILRFDYDPVAFTSRGILLEGSSTNIALQSNTFSNAAWTLVVTVAQNVTGPDGIANSAWTFTSTGNLSLAAQGGLSPGATNTHSYWAKAGTANFAYIGANNGSARSFQWFNLATGAKGTTGTGGPTLSSPQIVAYPNGWYRISVTADSTTVETDIGLSDADNTTNSTSGKTIQVFGAQVEAMSFASSYIPTTVSSASRGADILSFNGVGTTATYFAQTFGLQNFAVNGNIIGTSDASSDVPLFCNGSVTSLGSFDGSVTLSQSLTGTFLGTVKSAVAGGPSSRSLLANGGTIGGDSNALLGGNGNSVLLFNGTSQNYGNLLQFGIWSTIFSSAQLQNLTNLNNFINFDANTLGGLGLTTLTRSGRYFSRKDYAEWLARIVAENKATQRQRDELIASVEAERNLTDTERADRDYANAEEEYGQSEDALFKNLTTTNHIKFSEAKERRAKARKERDHHYFMEVVKKAWDEYNNK